MMQDALPAYVKALISMPCQEPTLASFWKLWQINKQLVITRSSPDAHNTKVCKSQNPSEEKCPKRPHGIIIVWRTHLLIKQYFFNYEMQNQQDADCKPKQSYELYLIVIFDCCPLEYFVCILYCHIYICLFLFTFMMLTPKGNRICTENYWTVLNFAQRFWTVIYASCRINLLFLPP